MDLDNLKKAWGDNLFTPRFSEHTIQRIISRKGKSALSRLLTFEIIGLIIILPLMAIPYIQELYFPRIPYPAFTKYFFIGSCILGFFWQIYKVYLLKKIDVKQINIVSGLKAISRYKLYIKREFFIGAAFLFIFVGSFTYNYVDTFVLYPKKIYFYCYNIILLLMGCVILFVFYKYFYRKNIKSIESALKEVNEMERDE